jgi:hypothetical protein
MLPRENQPLAFRLDQRPIPKPSDFDINFAVIDLLIKIMTDLERSQAELRAARLLAGKEIRKLNFGRADTSLLRILRRVLPKARAVARKEGITAAAGFADALIRQVVPSVRRHQAFDLHGRFRNRK